VLRLAEEALPISVRTATAADAPAIAVIGQVAFPALHEHIVGAEFSAAVVAQTYSIEALNDCIARCASADDAEFLVAERGGTVVGYLHYDCEGMEPELHRIYVDPALKRSGIGSALMDDLHARLPLGCSYVLLVAEENESAQRFYERHGLITESRIDGPSYYRDAMKLELDAQLPAAPAVLLRFTKTAG